MSPSKTIVGLCLVAMFTVHLCARPTVQTYSVNLPPKKVTVPLSQPANGEVLCMALNIFFEARNQRADDALAAIGYTVLNRVAAPNYPNDICSVVYQGKRAINGNYIRNKCQFSWVCDRNPDTPNTQNKLEARAWDRAYTIAEKVIANTIPNPVGSSTMYHAIRVTPYWTSTFQKVASIEDHVFYTSM